MTLKIQTMLMVFLTKLHITVAAAMMPGRVRVASKAVEGGITVVRTVAAVAAEVAVVDLVGGT